MRGDCGGKSPSFVPLPLLSVVAAATALLVLPLIVVIEAGVQILNSTELSGHPQLVSEYSSMLEQDKTGPHEDFPSHLYVEDDKIIGWARYSLDRLPPARHVIFLVHVGPAPGHSWAEFDPSKQEELVKDLFGYMKGRKGKYTSADAYGICVEYSQTTGEESREYKLLSVAAEAGRGGKSFIAIIDFKQAMVFPFR